MTSVYYLFQQVQFIFNVHNSGCTMFEFAIEVLVSLWYIFFQFMTKFLKDGNLVTVQRHYIVRFGLLVFLLRGGGIS